MFFYGHGSKIYQENLDRNNICFDLLTWFLSITELKQIISQRKCTYELFPLKYLTKLFEDF